MKQCGSFAVISTTAFVPVLTAVSQLAAPFPYPCVLTLNSLNSPDPKLSTPVLQLPSFPAFPNPHTLYPYVTPPLVPNSQPRCPRQLSRPPPTPKLTSRILNPSLSVVINSQPRPQMFQQAALTLSQFGLRRPGV